jgi:hypothetical protein
VQREDAEKIVVGGSKTIRKMITQAVGNELQGREEAPRVLDRYKSALTVQRRPV